jgi:cohesin loading factor subunit SCC2
MGTDEVDTVQAPTEISPQLKTVLNERVAVIIKLVHKDIMLKILHDVFKSVG